MNFIKDLEFIILMELNSYVPDTIPLTLENKISMHDVGIRTIIEYPEWRDIEPVQYQYDFSSIDKIIETNRQAGLKTIFPVYGNNPPLWMPDDWFCMTKDDGIFDRRILSLWNNEAQEHALHYYRKLVERYTSDDIMFTMGELGWGEVALPPTPATYFDKYAMIDYERYCGVPSVPDISISITRAWLQESIIDHYINVQRVLFPQHHEIWDSMQHIMTREWPDCANFVHRELMLRYKKHFGLNITPSIVLLQYTYFDETHDQENENYVFDIVKDVGCDVIVEAHFCAGLKDTTPAAIAKGFRGQILCPLHPQCGQKTIEPWMLDEIRKAHELWLLSSIV